MCSEAVLKEDDEPTGTDRRVSAIEGETHFSSVQDLKEKIENFEDPFSRLDIRVGKIIYVQEFVMSNKMYCNHILYDERNAKVAMSEIKGHYNKKKLKNKKVVFVANVKYKIRYFESEAFILYARDKEKKIKELLEPPTDSEVGDRIIAPGIPFIPTIQMPYIKPTSEGKAILDKVTKDMWVDSEGFATYKGIRLQNIMNGMITAPTLRDCRIKR